MRGLCGPTGLMVARMMMIRAVVVGMMMWGGDVWIVMAMRRWMWMLMLWKWDNCNPG